MAPSALEVLACGEGELVLLRHTAGPDDLTLRWGDQTFTLHRRDGGARYEADGAVYRPNDAASTLSLQGGRELTCRSGEPGDTIARVGREGGIVWAVGNEPGWFLALYPSRFRLVADYGEAEHEGPVVAEAGEEGAPDLYRGQTADGPIEIRVERGLCQDGMSGASFGLTVVIDHRGQQLRGCGLALDL